MSGRKGRTRGSMKYQTIEKMKSMTRFGESKHKAKQEEKERCRELGIPWNPARVDGIFSHETFDSYKEHTMNFVNWMEHEHPEINRIEDIEKSHAVEYLEREIELDRSAWTLHGERAALNKVYELELTRKDIALPSRDREEITRSRGEKEHDKQINREKHERVTEFCRGTGVRRHELEQVRPKDIYRTLDGTVKIHIEKGKGGQSREIIVLEKYRDYVMELKHEREDKDRLFDKREIPGKLDIHELRRDYAQQRYMEVVKQLPPMERGEKMTVKDKDGHEKEISREYRCKDGTVFDREAMLIVTEDLGHHREGIMATHYLR